MTICKSYAALTPKAKLVPYSFERRAVGPLDVAIDIKFCGICHSDIHQVGEDWGQGVFPMVPGHEIAGVVAKVGGSVTKFKVGDSVGVGCFIDSCRTCTPCNRKLEQYCENGATFTYNSLERGTQKPTYGGYSNHIVVDQNYVLRIPKVLPLDAAAPLLCAGITMFSPLRHWQVKAGSKVAIVGLGGLGHMGVKLAKAMGAHVTVLSHSNKKRDDAKNLGSDEFYTTSDPATFKILNRKFDLIINTVSVVLDLNEYLSLLALDGNMVLVGLPDKPSLVSAFPLISGRRSLSGSVIGGIAETQEMLDFCGKHQITCDIEKISIQKVNEAFERVIKSDVRYRFVLDMSTI
jgi:uncharacterized zinc-type alcohol dehydrogenase-like protein